MAWTAPRTWVAGETVTAALLNTHVRDNLKAIGDPWTSYTPTYGGFTIGNAVVTAKYLQAGKLVIGEVKIVFGSTSTWSGTFTVSMPVTASLTLVPVGTAFMSDASTSANRFGVAVLNSTTTVAFVDSGGTNNTSSTAPFTWANGDILAFAFTYEAA